MRFRMDAALYEPIESRLGQMGRPRKKGKRLPTLEKVAADKHPAGSASPSRNGMVKRNARLKSPLEPAFGIIQSCPFAG